MVELLHKLVPNFSHVEEFPISNQRGDVFGYQSVLMISPRYPFAGGTASDLNTARRICTAEAVERSVFFSLNNGSNELRLKFMLDQFPTTCGFAAGFDRRATIYRAVCEAVERWAWSKWVDEGFQMKNVTPKLLSPLELHFSKSFDCVKFYEVGIQLLPDLLPDFVPTKFIFSAVVGTTGNGIFPGSRVTTASDKQWEHPLLEAWRHQNIFRNELLGGVRDNLFDKRIAYFGKHGSENLEMVSKALSAIWPNPKLQLLERATAENKFHVWRALCDDYRGWHLGDETRFVY